MIFNNFRKMPIPQNPVYTLQVSIIAKHVIHTQKKITEYIHANTWQMQFESSYSLLWMMNHKQTIASNTIYFATIEYKEHDPEIKLWSFTTAVRSM